MECFYQGTQQVFATKPTAVVATWTFWYQMTSRQRESYLLGRVMRPDYHKEIRLLLVIEAGNNMSET